MTKLPPALQPFAEPLRQHLRGRASVTLDEVKRQLPYSRALNNRHGVTDGHKVARLLRHVGWEFADRRYQGGETIVTYRPTGTLEEGGSDDGR